MRNEENVWDFVMRPTVVTWAFKLLFCMEKPWLNHLLTKMTMQSAISGHNIQLLDFLFLWFRFFHQKICEYSTPKKINLFSFPYDFDRNFIEIIHPTEQRKAIWHLLQMILLWFYEIFNFLMRFCLYSLILLKMKTFIQKLRKISLRAH